MSSNEHLLRRYADLIAPDSDPDLIQTVSELDAASSSSRALRPPAALEDAIDTMIRERRAGYRQHGRSAPTPLDDGDAHRLHLPQHIARDGMQAHRTSKGWLRQSLELAAAVVAILLVTAVLVAVFRDNSDDSAGNQAAPVTSPTSPAATPAASASRLDNEGLQTIEDVLTPGATRIDLTHLIEQGKDGHPGRVIRVERMRLGDALVQGNWASQDLSRQDDPDGSVWEVEVANVQVGHSCPIGSPPENCNWDHLIWVIHAMTGETIGLRYPDTMPPPIPPEARLPTVEDAIARAHDLVPGQDGQAARIVGVWLLTPAEADLGEGWDESSPIWQVEIEGGAEAPAPCSAPPGVEANCPADHLLLNLHAVTGNLLGYRLLEPVTPVVTDASTPPAATPSPSPPGNPVPDLPEDAALRNPEEAGASALHLVESILQAHEAAVVRADLVVVSDALETQMRVAGSAMQVWDTATLGVPVWVVQLAGASFHRYDCDACPTGTTALLTIRAQDEALYWAAVGSQETTNMTQVIPDLPENIDRAGDRSIEEMAQDAIAITRDRGMIESGEPEVLLAMPATAATLQEMGLGGPAYAESCQRPFFVVILRGDFSDDYQYIGYVFDQASGAPGEVTLEINSATDEPFRQALGGEPVVPPITASPEALPESPSVSLCEDIWV